MNFRRKILTVLVFALALSLVGVTGIAQGQAVKNPDTLIRQCFGDPETLDPSWAYDTASAEIISHQLYESLIFYRGGRTDLYVPMLATEVPSVANGGISRDGKTYTFKIRPGVKFHDGNTMTADDVKYSLMRFSLIDRDGGPSWILLAPILGFDKQTTRDSSGKLIPTIWNEMNRSIQVRGNNVVITLKAAYAPFLNIMAQWSMVVSKKFVVANNGWDGANATLAKFNNPEKADQQELFSKAAGTGPFTLERWDRAAGIVTLVRNDAYWRAPAKLRRVVIQKVDEFSTRRLALQNGDADFICLGGRADQPAVTGLPGVRIVDDLGALFNSPALFMNLAISTEGGNPNIGSGRLDGNGIPPNFFTDIRVRRAMAHLFDREAWIRDVNRGKGRLGNGPVPFGLLGYHPRGRWYEPSRERAIAELREAHGGQVWNNGMKFTVLFNTGNTGRQVGAQMLKEALEAINPKFQIEVRGVVWSTYLAQVNDKKLPMFFIGWHGDYADPDNFTIPFMHSTGTFSGRQSYKSAEADRIIEQAARETDQKKREQLYFQLQEIAYRDIPTIYIVYTVDIRIMRSWVRGWYHNPAFPGTGYFYAMSKQ